MSGDGVQRTPNEEFADLLEILSGVHRPGGWLASGALEVPMPAVEVEGAGMLSFPVPAAQARELIVQAATRAPYGRGAATLVDETVRKVWQIAAAKVTLRGQGWAAAFAAMVRKIAEDLGCEDVPVEAQFYKLLVYEEGGFFLAHRDSEKAGGMFGTLVVVLPSAHTGGDLVIRHAGQETVLELQPGGPAEIQYAAFYADCEHEVRPVRSGFRVCLIYNLVQTKRGRALQPPEHGPATAQAAARLAGWAQSGAGPDKLVHLLEHRYTTAGLALAALKGMDAALAQVLLPAAARAGCLAHLAMVHVEESGWAEYTGYTSARGRYEDDESDGMEVGEVCDGRYYIDQWRNAADELVAFGEVPLENDELLPPEALDDEPPDECHFSEATGNAGASFERTYLRAALVLWPQARTNAICASVGPDAALTRLAQLAASPATAEEAEHLARHLPTLVHPGQPKAQRLIRLLEALRELGRPGLLAEIALPHLLAGYDGEENAALLSCLPLLGEAAATHLLSTLLRTHGPASVPGALELWPQLAQAPGTSRQLLQATLAALLQAMGQAAVPPPVPGYAARSALGTIEAVKAAIAAVEAAATAAPAPRPAPAVVAQFLAVLHASLGAAAVAQAVSVLLQNAAFFAPETVLLPALEAEGGPSATATAELWLYCARHYLARSEHPPVPPADWAQPVTLPGRAPHLRELERFARDPTARGHRFTANEAIRRELEHTIAQANLDMTHTTECKGRPYTLVCTKTQATYERACRQHAKDVAAMQRLLALPHAKAKAHAAEAERLRQAVPRQALPVPFE